MDNTSTDLSGGTRPGSEPIIQMGDEKIANNELSFAPTSHEAPNMHAEGSTAGQQQIAATVPMERQKRELAALYTPIAIVIAGVFMSAGLFFGLSHSGAVATAPSGSQPAAAAAVNIANVKTAGEPFVGDPNAPVTMAFWSDYQCPFCKAWETGGVPQIPGDAVLPQLMTQYVDTGKLKIVFKDFQFLGPDSTQDGEWARAIWKLYPSQFFAWRTAIYTQAPEENSLSAAQNLTHLEKVTGSVSGINVQAVEADVAKNKSTYDAAMSADEQEGQTVGIQGTPGFVIGTTLISGDEPLANFTSAIDALLNK
ncbi:MAG TPA: thioredoxin domain-containing protein [Candidatus Paceibacterota bacterium]|nr:thioredoxin domain-containing protein [Candidatus Paceibacterota bacterium]